MLSQRAVFSLKGTNINLPTHYKIRRYKASKTKSQKQEDHKTQQQINPIIIEAKQTFQLRFPSEVRKKSKQPKQTVTISPGEPSSAEFLESRSTVIKECNKLQDSLTALDCKKDKDKECPFSFIRKNREHYSSLKTKRCTCGDCPQCLKDFGYYLNLFSDERKLPQISAKSWCVWRKKNGKYTHYYGKRIHKVREIASLTKMVTAMTVIDFLTKFNMNPEKIFYEVKKTSTMVGGTTAHLFQGQVCSLIDLLYGMMLPSGNDAAIALSQAIGLLSFIKSRSKACNPESVEWHKQYTKNYSYLFIAMMNQHCQKAGTLDTKFFNSHGNDAYDQLKNISTCNEVAKIASQFMSYPMLREIVKTPQYKSYQNTNKLLQDGFDGIKTGITDTAGPCLAASYKDFIIVVLNSKSMNERWFQVKKLVKWILKKS